MTTQTMKGLDEQGADGDDDDDVILSDVVVVGNTTIITTTITTQGDNHEEFSVAKKQNVASDTTYCLEYDRSKQKEGDAAAANQRTTDVDQLESEDEEEISFVEYSVAAAGDDDDDDDDGDQIVTLEEEEDIWKEEAKDGQLDVPPTSKDDDDDDSTTSPVQELEEEGVVSVLPAVSKAQDIYNKQWDDTIPEAPKHIGNNIVTEDLITIQESSEDEEGDDSELPAQDIYKHGDDTLLEGATHVDDSATEDAIPIQETHEDDEGEGDNCELPAVSKAQDIYKQGDDTILREAAHTDNITAEDAIAIQESSVDEEEEGDDSELPAVSKAQDIYKQGDDTILVGATHVDDSATEDAITIQESYEYEEEDSVSELIPVVREARELCKQWGTMLGGPKDANNIATKDAIPIQESPLQWCAALSNQNQYAPTKNCDDQISNESHDSNAYSILSALQGTEEGVLSLEGPVDCAIEDGVSVGGEGDLKTARKLASLPGRQLRRNSVGSLRSIFNQEIKKRDHANLKRQISSLLDPCVDIEEEHMQWRKGILQDLKDKKELTEMETVKEPKESEYYFVHPLHIAEDPQDQRRRLSYDDDDVSVMSTDSMLSTWSTGPNYQSWFGTSARRRPSLPWFSRARRSMYPTGRRFLDLTVNGGQDDFEENHEDDDESDQTSSKVGDLDDCISDLATSYSIPVQNRTREKSEPSIARQFLDLTDGNDVEQEMGHQNSKRFSFAWMGRSTSFRRSTMSSFSRSHCDLYLSEDDDTDSIPSIDEDNFATAGWEKADAAFIEGVHDISSNLERTLNEQGLESPFWSFEEIIPSFKGLHSKIKENMDRLKKDYETPPVDPTPPEVKKISKRVKSPNGSMVRLSRRRSSELRGTRRTLLPHQDSTDSYDDLGMRTLQRDDRAYLHTFLYEYRQDGICSLPLVLSSGLQKHLGYQTTETALDILHQLTSPLRPRRDSVVGIVTEQEDEELLPDSSGGSVRKVPSTAISGPLRESMGQIHESDASIEQLLPHDKCYKFGYPKLERVFDSDDLHRLENKDSEDVVIDDDRELEEERTSNGQTL